MPRLLLALLASLLGLGAAHAGDGGRFVELGRMGAEGVPPLGVTVWLPPDYDGGRRRYPVVYMHDGQNLFFRARSNFDKVWAADKAALRLIAARRVAPFIIVGIDQPGPARAAQYMPQALYEAASPSLRAALGGMVTQPVYSDAYLRFIVGTLKPAIDRRFRTRPGRMETAIIGSSMGGLISCYAFTRHPRVFGRAGCVSTHWPMGVPDATAPYRDEIVRLWSVEFARGLGRADGRRLWMDHGDQTLDSHYAPYQRAITPALRASGWREGRDFVVHVYPGAPHEENAWAARMGEIFAWLMPRR